MNIFKKAIATVTLCAMALSFSACRSTAETLLAKDSFKICCSFYPMYVMTMNIAGGIDGVEVVSMSDPNMGCIHDHVFSTEDLKKIEGADVFVENGLELEVFYDEIL